VEECQQSENAPAAVSGCLVAEQPHIMRSSSTPDVMEPLCSDSTQGQKVENVQTLSSSESKPVQENKGHVKKEHEGITILVRRSSSPAELDLKDDLQQTQGKCKETQKSKFQEMQSLFIQLQSHLFCFLLLSDLYDILSFEETWL